MWNHQVSTNLLTRLFLLSVLSAHLLETARALLSDKRLCADEHCKAIISMGVGKISYAAGEEGMISFKARTPIRIKSKGAGTNPSIWGIEVHGREGYAPKEYILEQRVIISEKNLKYIVDVEQKKKDPVLSTSEVFVEQGSVPETAATKPLNFTLAESSEHHLKKTSDEKISAENLPAATPVLSEIVDATKAPILENEKDLKDIVAETQTIPETKSETKSEIVDSTKAPIVGNEKEVKDIPEVQTIPDTKSEPEVYKKDEGEISPISKEQVKKDEPSSASEKRENENELVKQSNEGKLNETFNKNPFNSKLNGELNKKLQVEAEKPKDNTNSQAGNTDSDSIVEEYTLVNENSLNSNDLTTKDQKANIPADVKTEKVYKAMKNEAENLKEVTHLDVTNVVSKRQSLEYTSANQKPLTGDDLSAKDEKANMFESVQNNSEKEKVLTNKDNHRSNDVLIDNEKEKTNLNSISINSEVNAAPNQELNINNVANLGNNFNNILEMKLPNEISDTNKKLSVKDEQVVQTLNENPTQQIKIVKDTVINNADVFSSSTGSSEDSVEKPNDQIEPMKSSGLNDSDKNISKKDEQVAQTLNENPTQQMKVVKETVVNNADVFSYSTGSSEDKVEKPNGQIEPKKSSELNDSNKNISKKDEQVDQTLNEYPTQPAKIVNETVVNNSSTGSSEDSVEKPSGKIQQNDELQDDTEQTITKEYRPTEANLNTEDNKNTIEMNAQKLASNDAFENNDIEDRANNKKILGESSSMLTENSSNSTNLHNQQEINNKVGEETSLQQPKEDSAKQMGNINNFSTESLPYDKESTEIYSVKTDMVTDPSIEKAGKIYSSSEQAVLNTVYQAAEELNSQAEVIEHINPTTFNPTADIFSPLPTYQEDITTNVPSNDNHGQNFKHSEENLDSIDKINNAATTTLNVDDQYNKKKHETTKVATPSDILEPKENKGLFATIMGTVNNMLSNSKKKQSDTGGDNEIHKIFSQENAQKNVEELNEEATFPYCKNIGPGGDCPESNEAHDHSTSHYHHAASKPLLSSDLTLEIFLTSMASKILEMSELIAFMAIAAAASLFFVFGYYCFCNSSREGALLLKLNQLESSLLASHKENAILKHNLMSTRHKLTSIEDNSFGSNDMVASLKKELEEELLEKSRLQEQITALQKELENAADAGIELNKIVAELLSNQSGDESIISSVEELQKQLNEQQNTIYEINASLAEKSRENSELQLMIAEQNARYEVELANVQRDNDELEHEKSNLLTRLEEMKTDFDKDITVALEGKNMEIKRLQNDILDLSNKLENEHTKWQTSVAKIEALEECLKNMRKDPKVNISEVIDVANVKAQLIEAQKMYKSLKERFETELDSRKLAENQLEVVSAEVEKLKQDFNQSEKDKLEAQTRLEVLSNYFKDKENQLQKELSLKEAMWLKQQGETTTTVDRVTAMQEEIQSLKSQNDSLRAEVEAQLAAHKAQIGTLENRAHETWLAARQSDRRYEEARAEATALRRKLTALAGGTVNESNKSSAGPVALGDDLTQAPSPIHMESPGSPMLGRMPLPPPFLPPPFVGPPPPFMGMPPPPPFVPPGEMRPAPLGRIMSPPPQRSGRFSPQHLDYEDYLDYEGNNTWHRYTYSPPPRTYRSLSPTDSRYNYGTERDLMSTYDTETDFSPPPSPRESRRRIGNSSERIDSNSKISYGNTKKFNSSNKGPLSSGSENSFNTHSHNDTKTKKGKNLV